MRRFWKVGIALALIASAAAAQLTRGPINQQGAATAGHVAVFGGNGIMKDGGGAPVTNALTSAHILVGNGSNVATDRAMSGVIAIDNTGATTFAAGTTGSGAVVLATSPTIATASLSSPSMTTPTLGVASATSINKVAITAPATSATLTLANGSTLATSGAFSTTLTATATTALTLPTTGTLATLAGSEALTNKTVNGLTLTSSTGTLTIANGSTLATSGANSITLTSSGATNVTLPTTGTLATLAGNEALTNKTISGASNTLSNIGNASLSNSAITIAGSSTSLGGTITASAILDSVGSTRGSLLYRGASGWAILTPGTSGYVLASNGAGADPSWNAVGGGGGAPLGSTLTDGYIFVGNSSNIAQERQPSGDVTITNAGVTAIGANKVTDAILRQSGALALVGRSANSTGNVADISASAASDCVFRESGSTISCGTVATAGIAANAVTFAKMQAVTTSRLLGSPTSTAVAEVTLGTGLSFSGSTLNVSGAGGGSVGIVVPQGRLTLTTGTPVMIADATAQTTVYYTPYNGSYVPIYDGSNWATYQFAELSQATTDSTKSPAAVIAESVYDVFVWNDSGTIRATRGPVWSQAQTFTVTIASPAVFTLNGHGFYEGMPVIFTTTGALPTGLTAGTTYYIISAGLTANAFEVSATVGGTAVNTSGTQSGTHTATQHSSVRGTGAGTSEITRLNGIWTNANAITNGPAANRGTYVGTIRTNTSSQVDMKFGGTGAAGGEASILGVWNAYNRIPTKLTTYDTTDTWNYTIATWRVKDGNMSNRIQFVIGVQEDLVHAFNHGEAVNSSGNINHQLSIGLNASNKWAVGKSTVDFGTDNVANIQTHVVSEFSGTISPGYGALFPLEISQASGTTTWYGDNTDNGAGTGNLATIFFVEIMAANDNDFGELRAVA